LANFSETRNTLIYAQSAKSIVNEAKQNNSAFIEKMLRAKEEMEQARKEAEKKAEEEARQYHRQAKLDAEKKARREAEEKADRVKEAEEKADRVKEAEEKADRVKEAEEEAALVKEAAAAAWWPKAGNTVSVGFGSKQQVWRDITAADAADIEGGMKVKLDRKSNGASCEQATVVKVGAAAGTWEVQYGEDGETEVGVVARRVKQRLYEWYAEYSTGTVKIDKGDGTFTIVIDGKGGPPIECTVAASAMRVFTDAAAAKAAAEEAARAAVSAGVVAKYCHPSIAATLDSAAAAARTAVHAAAEVQLMATEAGQTL
jgi:membrane protein involved in colicin uptake